MPKSFTKKSTAQLALAITAALNTTPSFAQNGVEEKSHLLDSFVVVGETTNTLVTPESLEKYQANDLADIFRHESSVSVGGSLGIAQKIYLRGLEDTYLNITVDGAPQTGTLFHHIGRVSIEPELLKEVDVQAGAGEATSGAGTIGGAIRFKTKSADDLLEDGKQYGALAKIGYASNNLKKQSITGYGKVSDDWGILGSFVNADRDNMEDGNGDELNGTSADQQLAFIKLNGHLTDSQELTVSYEQRKENGEFGARPNWPTLQGETLFPMDGERNTFVLNHSLTANDIVNLETTFYYTNSEITQDRFDRWGKYNADVTSYGFDIRNTSYINNHTMTYGADYRNDNVQSKYLADPSIWQPWAWDPAIDSFEEEGQISGIYFQNHWQATNQLLISLGARYDHYKLKEVTYGDKTQSSGLSPNIGFKYNFTDELKLTAGYAEAMRGKEVGDAFTLEHQAGKQALQPGLNPEKVKNTEIGLEYDNGYLLASASIYHSKIDDVIQDQLGRGVYHENVGELETEGFELKLGYNWDKVSIIASYVNNDTELNGNMVEGYEHIGLANSRGDTWNLDLIYMLNDSLEFGWNYTHVAALNNIDVLQRGLELGWVTETEQLDKKGYDVHDIYVQWQATPALTLDFAIHNLFDKQYRDHSSVGDYTHIAGWESVSGLNEAGRDVRITASYSF